MMRTYRAILVWALRLLALAQVALGALTIGSLINVSRAAQVGGPMGQISGPMALVPRDPIEHVIATLLGPVVCLAVAEILAALNSRKAGQAQ
jgi:hypothetical protein